MDEYVSFALLYGDWVWKHEAEFTNARGNGWGFGYYDGYGNGVCGDGYDGDGEFIEEIEFYRWR